MSQTYWITRELAYTIKFCKVELYSSSLGFAQYIFFVSMMKIKNHVPLKVSRVLSWRSFATWTFYAKFYFLKIMYGTNYLRFSWILQKAHTSFNYLSGTSWNQTTVCVWILIVHQTNLWNHAISHSQTVCAFSNLNIIWYFIDV